MNWQHVQFDEGWNFKHTCKNKCLINHWSPNANLKLSCLMTKPTKWHVHPAKTQISLGIHPVWSESLLSAWRKLGSLATHWVHSEDSVWSDWWDAQADLSLRCALSHFVGFIVRRLNLRILPIKLSINIQICEQTPYHTFTDYRLKLTNRHLRQLPHDLHGNQYIHSISQMTVGWQSCVQSHQNRANKVGLDTLVFQAVVTVRFEQFIEYRQRSKFRHVSNLVILYDVQKVL